MKEIKNEFPYLEYKLLKRYYVAFSEEHFMKKYVSLNTIISRMDYGGNKGVHEIKGIWKR